MCVLWSSGELWSHLVCSQRVLAPPSSSAKYTYFGLFLFSFLRITAVKNLWVKSALAEGVQAHHFWRVIWAPLRILSVMGKQVQVLGSLLMFDHGTSSHPAKHFCMSLKLSVCLHVLLDQTKDTRTMKICATKLFLHNTGNFSGGWKQSALYRSLNTFWPVSFVSLQNRYKLPRLTHEISGSFANSTSKNKIF